MQKKKAKALPPSGLGPETAKLEFSNLAQSPDAVVDFCGPTERYRQRVRILTKTVLTHRDAVIKAQGYQLREKEIKKPTQSQVDSAYRKSFVGLDDALIARNQMDAKGALQQLVSSSGKAGGSFQMDQFQLANIRKAVENQEDATTQ